MRNVREWMRWTTVPKHGERQDKNADLRAAIQRSRHDVVVLVEQVRVVLAQPPLRGKAQNEVGETRRVDTCHQPTHVPQNDGQIDICEELLPPEPVGKPERDGDGKSEQEGERHPLIPSPHGEHVLGNTPRDGQAVELLNVRPTPDVRTLDGCQDGCLTLHNPEREIPVRNGSITPSGGNLTSTS